MRDLSTALVTLLGLVACGRGDEARGQPEPAPVAAPSAPPSAPPAGPTGTIRGVVKLRGTPPEMPRLQRGSDPVCGATEATAETVLAGADGTLSNALVRVAPGTVPASRPAGPVVVDQRDCMYRPRVQPGVVGQTVEIRNADPTAHNVNARRLELGKRADLDTIFNRGQPAGSAPVSTPLEPGVEVVKLKCDMHGWMQGFVVVSDNPYAAVSAAGGRFSIPDVPVGARELQVWHEFYGVKAALVTVAEGEEAVVELEFDATADRPASAGALPVPAPPAAVE